MEFQSNNFSISLFLWQVFAIIWMFFWIYCLVDAYKRNVSPIWFLIILFVPFFGSIFYISIGRKTKLNS